MIICPPFRKGLKGRPLPDFVDGACTVDLSTVSAQIDEFSFDY